MWPVAIGLIDKVFVYTTYFGAGGPNTGRSNQMAKSVKTVKNSLKFKAKPRSGMLSVRVGVKKHTLPVDVRMLADGGYIFLSFPACSELFEIKDNELRPMPPDADATAAYAALNPTKRRERQRSTPAELPNDVAEALKAIPPGFKIGYTAEGKARLVRTRGRTG